MIKGDNMKIMHILAILSMASFTYALVYYWPLDPYVSDWYSRGTFCEYREGPPTHFHEGIDIPASGSFPVVSSATYSFKCIDFGDLPYNMGKFVTVQHYEVNGQTTAVDEGSRYLHMGTINSDLQREQIYIDAPIATNTSFWEDHLHFEMRDPAPVFNDDKNSFNPFSIYAPPDEHDPYLDYLYVDGSTQHQGDATIENWNFLGYDFSNYYNGYISSPFIRLTLPTESSGNDLDDPHFMISGNCKVRFILKAKDQISTGYSVNCAPYSISLFFADQIPFGEDELYDPDKTPFHQLKFDYLDNTQNEERNEEDVYHTESPLVSDQSTFYYRLYPHDKNGDGYPGCIINPNRYLSTEGLQNGQYPIRIVVTDYDGNTKTADVHFYVRKQNWVDYCRAFNY